MVNSEELTGKTEYLTSYTRSRINRCRYNRVRMHTSNFNRLLLQLRTCLSVALPNGISVRNKKTSSASYYTFKCFYCAVIPSDSERLPDRYEILNGHQKINYYAK